MAKWGFITVASLLLSIIKKFKNQREQVSERHVSSWQRGGPSQKLSMLSADTEPMWTPSGGKTKCRAVFEAGNTAFFIAEESRSTQNSPRLFEHTCIRTYLRETMPLEGHSLWCPLPLSNQWMAVKQGRKVDRCLSTHLQCVQERHVSPHRCKAKSSRVHP